VVPEAFSVIKFSIIVVLWCCWLGDRKTIWPVKVLPQKCPRGIGDGQQGWKNHDLKKFKKLDFFYLNRIFF